MDPRKKNVVIVSICSTILFVMAVGVVIMNLSDGDDELPNDLSSSKKAIMTVCDTTDYKQTCLDSLNSAGTNSSDPRELIQVVFQESIKYIDKAVGNSATFQKLEKDPRAKSALRTCNELAQRAAEDLKRSLAKFNGFDVTRVDDILLDLKIWISGAMTHQETCLDGFQDVQGEAGQKMRDSLKAGMEMSSNVLAMVVELSTYLESMGSFKRRRLLSEASGEFPEWTDSSRHRLLAAQPQQIRADIVVAKDGSGRYKTISEALKNIPRQRNGVFVVYIKEGVYEENVRIGSSLRNLLLIGDGPTRTRITGKLNFIDGVPTYHTATVAVHGDGFFARDIGFENSAGPEKHQAVALRVSADKSVFYNCHMDGYQDTLYTHTYRQFYRDCVISGTIDFIFGDGAVVFQGCTMSIRKPLDNQQCIVTAQGRKEVRQPTGLVLQNCTIKADPEHGPDNGKIKSYLGRPWKAYSRTIILESFIDNLIQPEGWLPWNETFALNTLFYTEFNNRGPSAPKMGRVQWPGIKELPSERIKRFTAADFLDGNRWIPQSRVPYVPGFIFPAPKEDPNVNYTPVAPEETQDLGSSESSTTSTTNSSHAEFASLAPPVSSPVPIPEHPIIVVTPATPPASSPASPAPSGEPYAAGPASGDPFTANDETGGIVSSFESFIEESFFVNVAPAPFGGSVAATPSPGGSVAPAPSAGSVAPTPSSAGSVAATPASSPYSDHVTAPPPLSEFSFLDAVLPY